MNNNFEYLPKYTLNQLADRVAMKVDYFNRLYKPDNIWNGIIKSCQTIEEEPRNVSTVIVDMKKDNEIAVTGTSIFINLSIFCSIIDIGMMICIRL